MEVEWRILRVLLPVEWKQQGRGRPPADNLNIINSILWRLRTGAPWRDVPKKYGKWNSIYRRLRRWSACSVWERVAIALAETMAESGHYDIDSTKSRQRAEKGDSSMSSWPLAGWRLALSGELGALLNLRMPNWVATIFSV